jgi:Ca2+-binding RTX toxin-like protein
MGGSGSDEIWGGDGIDTANYDFRNEKLRLSADGLAASGAAGETDRIMPDVENLTGGKNNDTIYGTDAVNILRGGKGNDVMYGYGGDDILLGQEGDDTIVGGAGIDLLHGGQGNDRLDARDGERDIVFGKEGASPHVGYDQASVDRGLDGVYYVDVLR